MRKRLLDRRGGGDRAEQKKGADEGTGDAEGESESPGGWGEAKRHAMAARRHGDAEERCVHRAQAVARGGAVER